MGASIIERIQQKLELFKLEQRYTRRRHRRSTFVSNAVYVDGEYVYPTSTGDSDSSASERPRPQPTYSATVTSAGNKPSRGRLNRWSSMPGFGSVSKATSARPSAQTSQSWGIGRFSASESR